jgi:hypothetical protein
VALRYMVGVDVVGRIGAQYTGPLDNYPQAITELLGECGHPAAATFIAANVSDWASPLGRDVVPAALETLFLAQDTDRGAGVVRMALRDAFERSAAAAFSIHPAWTVHRMGSGWIDQAIAMADGLVDEPGHASPPPTALGERAIVWLGFVRAARVVSALTRLAATTSLPVSTRVLAIEALADNGRDGALAGVARAATDPGTSDPAETSQFLSAVDVATARLAHQSTDPVPLLTALLDRAESAGNVIAVAHALRNVGRYTKEAEPRLRAGLTHENALVRVGAAAGLASMLGADAVADVEAVFNESSQEFERTQLLATLARIGMPEDVERLEAHLFDPALSERALWALDRPYREELLAGLATDEHRGAVWAELLHLPAVAPYPDPRSPAERFAAARPRLLATPTAPPAAAPSEAPPPPASAPAEAPAPPAADATEAEAPTEPVPPRGAAGQGRPNSQADEPADQDRLGRRGLVEILAAMLDDPHQETPFTLALFGAWGSGKSSVLRQLRARLEDKERQTLEWRVADFNAWRYERTDNLAAGLVQEAVAAITPQGRGRLAFRLRYGWARHRARLVWSLLVLVASLAAAIYGLVIGAADDSIAKIFIGLGGVSVFSVVATALLKLYQHPVSTELMTYFRLPTYGQHLGLLEAMRSELKTLWTIARKHHPSRRLLVIVDDLDRCSPPAIASTLDAIRLVMDLPEVVVVIAVDERIGLGAIALEYDELATDTRPPADVARDFLAKIVQLPIRLPVPIGIEDYVRGELFPQPASSNGDAPPTTTSDAGDAQRAKAPLEPARPDAERTPSSSTASTPSAEFAGGGSELAGTYGQNAAQEVSQSLLREAMREAPDEVSTFLALAGLSEITNPRQLRRLRNTYRFTKAFAPALEWHPLLSMVFWQELLHSSPLEEHRRHQDSIAPAADADSVVARLAANVASDLDDQRYGAYRDAVLVAVLPRLEVDRLAPPPRSAAQRSSSPSTTSSSPSA